jgi:hypothetical protein
LFQVNITAISLTLQPNGGTPNGVGKRTLRLD